MKIGIRDLKNRAPQVVREVRESGEAAEITYRGATVAYLTPAVAEVGDGDLASAWKTFDKVVEAIGRRSKARKRVRPNDWRRDL